MKSRTEDRAPFAAPRVAPSQGRGSKPERPSDNKLIVGRRVAPSQGRGSKRCARDGTPRARGIPSPPHRGADRNDAPEFVEEWTVKFSRPLTGAWIETNAREMHLGSMTRSSPPHRGVDRNLGRVITIARHGNRRRPLTGAWIETSHAWNGFCTQALASPPHRGVDRNSSADDPVNGAGRPLTGAWIETRPKAVGRPLTGAWIETCRLAARRSEAVPRSPPHRGVDRNPAATWRRRFLARWLSPPHRGVDRNTIVTGSSAETITGGRPSQGRGSKRPCRSTMPPTDNHLSPPHRGVDRNLTGLASQVAASWVAPSQGRGSKPVRAPLRAIVDSCRPLTGAWIETTQQPCRDVELLARLSPPHRGVDRNAPTWLERASPKYDRRPLTGAWIETLPTRRGHGRVDQRSPPHRGVDRNIISTAWTYTQRRASPPHRGVDRNDLVPPQLAPRRHDVWSPPHRGVDRNCGPLVVAPISRHPRRPLTGAWIETLLRRRRSSNRRESPPHRGVDRNPILRQLPLGAMTSGLSPPHRGVDRNSNRPSRRADPLLRGVAPSQGRGSKRLLQDERRSVISMVAPSQGRGSKRFSERRMVRGLEAGRPLTGAWIET